MKAVVKSWNDRAAQHTAAAVERHRLGALVHGSELRTYSPVPRAGLTPLGSCQASRNWSSC